MTNVQKNVKDTILCNRSNETKIISFTHTVKREVSKFFSSKIPLFSLLPRVRIEPHYHHSPRHPPLPINPLENYTLLPSSCVKKRKRRNKPVKVCHYCWLLRSVFPSFIWLIPADILPPPPLVSRTTFKKVRFVPFT